MKKIISSSLLVVTVGILLSGCSLSGLKRRLMGTPAPTPTPVVTITPTPTVTPTVKPMTAPKVTVAPKKKI